MTVRFHPEVSTELEAAALWYEGEQAGLGVAFLAEAERATAAIEAAPATWPFVRKSRRVQRFLLARFPYAILKPYLMPSSSSLWATRSDAPGIGAPDVSRDTRDTGNQRGWLTGHCS